MTLSIIYFVGLMVACPGYTTILDQRKKCENLEATCWTSGGGGGVKEEMWGNCLREESGGNIFAGIEGSV